MKLANVALVSIVVFGIATVGCKGDETDNESLGTNEAQLVEDDSEASTTDDDLEAGLDEPLSGADETDPGNPAQGLSLDEIVEKVRLLPGRFFTNASCVESLRDGNRVKHVLKACHGLNDIGTFEGTVDSTYDYADGKLTVTHALTGFGANGATITGSRVIEYTRSGDVVTKTRHGNWSGTTAKGKPITHEASFVTTYDASTKCLTRDGSAESSIGGRSFERSVDGYKRCGIGRLGCPESGTISLTKTKSGDALTVSIEFPGGARYNVTRPNGREVTRPLVCRPNAS